MPRIIPPSSTACPPTGASRLATSLPSGMRSGSPPLLLLEGVVCDACCAEPVSGLTVLPPAGPVFGGATLEPLDATTGVDQLLLAGVERGASGVKPHVQVVFRRPRVELVAARAVHVGEGVIGVD